jgi:dCTP deaminase
METNGGGSTGWEEGETLSAILIKTFLEQRAMILNDYQIKEIAEKGAISPFIPSLIRSAESTPVISYGASSYGYDLRLSPKEFLVFKKVPGVVVNPKRFDTRCLEETELHTDEFGSYFILPAHSYGLGVAMERLNIPDDITCLFIGKSTYARCGIIANLTPGEAAWEGYLTLEISNCSSADCRIYANEGIVQALFLRGEKCSTSYGDRNGKYQGQLEQVTLAKC